MYNYIYIYIFTMYLCACVLSIFHQGDAKTMQCWESKPLILYLKLGRSDFSKQWTSGSKHAPFYL